MSLSRKIKAIIERVKAKGDCGCCGEDRDIEEAYDHLSAKEISAWKMSGRKMQTHGKSVWPDSKGRKIGVGSLLTLGNREIEVVDYSQYSFKVKIIKESVGHIVEARKITVIRAGKRVRKLICPDRYKAQNGKCVRITAKEHRIRMVSQRRGAKKRKVTQKKAIRLRARSMKRRTGMPTR